MINTMKKILILFFLPFLSHGQLSLSGSPFTVFKVENGVCSNNEISVNGIYTLDGDFSYSKSLNLEGTDPKICFNGTIYSIPTNKLIISYIIGSNRVGKWVLGFYSLSFGIPIFPVEISSLNTKTPVPSCNGPAFGGTLISSPTISGINCVGNTLTASAIQGSSFQWYKDGVKVNNATTSNYIPTEMGSYQVANTRSNYWRETPVTGNTSLINNLFFLNENMGWLTTENGSIFKTTNAGYTWQSQNSGVSTSLKSVAFTDSENGIIVGNGGVILKTINGGNTWQLVPSGVTNNMSTVKFIGSGTGWAVGDKYTILKTANSGATWNIINSNNSLSSSDTYLDLQFTDSNTGFLLGRSQTGAKSFVLKTINGGQSWDTTKTGTISELRAISFINNNIGWIGVQKLNSTISKTTDGGITWTEFPYYDGVPQCDCATSMSSIHFINAQTGWMITRPQPGSLDIRIRRTIDGGATFTTDLRFSTLYTLQYQFSTPKLFMSGNGSFGYLTGSTGNILKFDNTFCLSDAKQVSPATVNPPNINASGTISICPGAKVTLVASGCSGTIQWSNNASGLNLVVDTAGTYSAICQTECNSSVASEPVVVQFKIPPSKSLSGNSSVTTERAGKIISNQTIPPNVATTYSASQSVILNSNFKTENGSVFIAKIEGCN